MTTRRPIVFATDFSRASARAFEAACALAKSERTPLVVLHVLTPPSPFSRKTPPSSWIVLEAAARRAARTRLSALVARAKTRVRASGMLMEGMPADAIGLAARRLRAGAIVVGTHSRSGVGRWFMGSVASRLVRTAPCPVLTVRGR
jgi:nucleotide-binding universal stress UspA family protein